MGGRVASADVAIDAATKAAQDDACDPAASAWVSANAGAGKTFVLARRVVRLLLAGTAPGRILCLTFTRAAAAQMETRVFDTLRAWSTLPDRALGKELAALVGRPVEAGERARARRLFARALDTPGGLKIQTIHAFCERLLQQFPFEANVAGHFEVLEQHDVDVMTDAARRGALAAAAGDRDGVLGEALRTVLSSASDFAHELAVADLIRQRARLRAWIQANRSLDAALDQLRVGLGVAAGDTIAAARGDVLRECALDAAAIGRLAGLLRDGSKTDKAAAARLAPFLSASDDDTRIDAWLAFCTKGDGQLRAAGSLVTKTTRQRWNGLDDVLDAEIARLRMLLERRAAIECFLTTAALVRLADAAIGRYERMKGVRRTLDFDDLIVKTVQLLSRSDAAAWVHYKLDGGVDHVLVDEAQDTSPLQWRVIRSLVEDFFAGEGRSPTVRTLFAVGDQKQSIFSFQGAAPAWFTAMQRELGRRAVAAGLTWRDPSLHLSFRSVPTVLAAVDRVFADEPLHRALSEEGAAPTHSAARHREPGRVVIWPMIAPPEQIEPPDWTTPLDHLGEASPEVQLARRIAGTAARWIHGGEKLDSGKPIRPGGILILSRIRGAQTDAINRALKSRGVPIAGADRLTLTDHIAVKDLMALARVVLLPDDDLSLAALLKSPLVGLDEDQLFALAYGRRGSLWDSLETAAAASGPCRDALRLLNQWRRRADFAGPHAFFARILGPDRGRLKIMGRLGAEAEDVLDEFLAQTIAYEQAHVPSLEGFLAWLSDTATEIRRDTDTMRDEVRVMTVHGAKGLEADIVFVVDGGMKPVHSGHDPRIMALADDRDGAPSPLVWMRRLRDMPPVVKARVETLRQDAYAEYLRLLYVAMTRARDRLYVCGTRKQTTDDDNGWHGLVTRALGPECVESKDADGNVALEWRPPSLPPAPPRPPQPGLPLGPHRPDWLTHKAPPPPPPPRLLTPSAVRATGEEATPVVTGRDAVAGTALVRGRLIHRLLQSLPDVAASARQAVGARYLAAVAGDLPEAERTALVAEVLYILADPGFAPVFAPGSRAEVDIAGRLGDAIVSGRVDRLAVTGDRVLIVDYKTNRPAPDTLQATPAAYVTQLALYRAVLRRLYPGRPVAAALLWTDRPALMDVPQSALDAAQSAVMAG